MSTPLVQARTLGKRYDVGRQAVHALRDVSLSIERGELVAIVGPSGSGKSTLLHLLGCLHLTFDGDYWLDGIAVREMSRDRLAGIRNARIGFVFQAFHLQPTMTAHANVELPLVYAHMRRRERHDRAAQALEKVGLGDRMSHRPAELSGGEMQRVAIARAMVSQPDLLLADEPTGALDSGTGREIMDLLEELNALGVTVVVVTHDDAVAAYAERRIQLLDGTVVADEQIP